MMDKRINEYLKEHLQTGLIGKITNVSKLNSHQVVNVKPSVAKVNIDYTALEYPILEDVPVLFPAGGGGLFSFPLKVGDDVLLVFCKESIGSWKVSNSGQETTPEVFSNFMLANAIAIPCLYTTTNNLSPDTDNVVLQFGGSTTTHYANGDVETIAAKDIIASAAGNINATSGGDITANSGGAATVTATTDINLNANANINITAVGDVNISGATINLN